MRRFDRKAWNHEINAWVQVPRKKACSVKQVLKWHFDFMRISLPIIKEFVLFICSCPVSSLDERMIIFHQMSDSLVVASNHFFPWKPVCRIHFPPAIIFQLTIRLEKNKIQKTSQTNHQLHSNVVHTWNPKNWWIFVEVTNLLQSKMRTPISGEVRANENEGFPLWSGPGLQRIS